MLGALRLLLKDEIYESDKDAHLLDDILTFLSSDDVSISLYGNPVAESIRKKIKLLVSGPASVLISRC